MKLRPPSPLFKRVLTLIVVAVLAGLGINVSQTDLEIFQEDRLHWAVDR